MPERVQLGKTIYPLVTVGNKVQGYDVSEGFRVKTSINGVIWQDVRIYSAPPKDKFDKLGKDKGWTPVARGNYTFEVHVDSTGSLTGQNRENNRYTKVIIVE